MHMPPQTTADIDADIAAAPSADFIQAVSQFLDTDPSDLLQELGYYSREAVSESSK